MKQRKISKTNVVNFSTYLGMVIFFLVMTALSKAGVLNRSMTGLLVPICCYMSMAVSLNLTVGILGELSLGHAGFMSVGAFAGVIASQSLLDVVPSAGLRLTIAMIVGALFATIAGFIVGAPVLRLQGDYLAIVTLAFGEIIKELVTCLIVGHDENGLHILFNLTGNKTVEDLGLSDTGIAIIKGAQGTASVKTIASFTAGFILVMVTLFIVLNLKHSRAGRAIMALRDNRIAAASIGINTTKYKLMAFVTSAALAGAAGALYGLNYSSLQAAKVQLQHLHPGAGVRGAGRSWQHLGQPGRCRGADHPAGGPPGIRRLPDAGVRHRADPGDAGDQQPHAAKLLAPGSSLASNGTRERRLP